MQSSPLIHGCCILTHGLLASPLISRGKFQIYAIIKKSHSEYEYSFFPFSTYLHTLCRDLFFAYDHKFNEFPFRDSLFSERRVKMEKLRKQKSYGNHTSSTIIDERKGFASALIFQLLAYMQWQTHIFCISHHH